jgi:hypothetical protein
MDALDNFYIDSDVMFIHVLRQQRRTLNKREVQLLMRKHSVLYEGRINATRQTTSIVGTNTYNSLKRRQNRSESHVVLNTTEQRPSPRREVYCVRRRTRLLKKLASEDSRGFHNGG